MMNKKWLLHAIAGISLAIFVVLGLASASQPDDLFAVMGPTLDDTIRTASARLASGMTSGSRVAVLSMESGSASMSSYIVEGIIDTLVGMGAFGVVNPFQVNLFAGELHLSMSELDAWDSPTPTTRSANVRSEWANISPEGVAQYIGNFMEVQFVIMGMFDRFGDLYRFRAQAIEVETGAVRAVYTAVIQNDELIARLLGPVGRWPQP